MLNETQQAERALRLGSSDAPVCAGVSPYKGPQTLFFQMTGKLPRYSQEETWEQKRGELMEPVIAELIAEREGLKIRRAPVRVHPSIPWMVAHLDFEIVNHPNGPGVFEIKRRNQRFHSLPDDIRIQVAHQLAVTNRDWGKVAVDFTWGEPIVFEVERDKDLELHLIEIERQFMIRVEKNDPPPFEYDAETASILKSLYPQESGQELILESEEAIRHWQTLLSARGMLGDVETVKESEEAWFKDQMREYGILKIPGAGVITWKTAKGSHKFDMDRFKTEHPDLIAQYQTVTPGSRRFLVKNEKKKLCQDE